MARVLLRTVGLGTWALFVTAGCGGGPAGKPIIPAGQESTLMQIFAAVGECTFAGGKVAGDSLALEYACASGGLVLDVRHARNPGDLRTQRFSVRVRSGKPPLGFLNELESQILAREGAFEWRWLPGEPLWARLFLPPRSPLESLLLVLVVLFPAATCLIGLLLLLRGARDYYRPASLP